jgi:hypothetical protein
MKLYKHELLKTLYSKNSNNKEIIKHPSYKINNDLFMLIRL